MVNNGAASILIRADEDKRESFIIRVEAAAEYVIEVHERKAIYQIGINEFLEVRDEDAIIVASALYSPSGMIIEQAEKDVNISVSWHSVPSGVRDGTALNVTNTDLMQ